MNKKIKKDIKSQFNNIEVPYFKLNKNICIKVNPVCGEKQINYINRSKLILCTTAIFIILGSLLILILNNVIIRDTTPLAISPTKTVNLTDQEKWLIENQNSTDEVYLAFMNWKKAIDEYKENNPMWSLRSDWILDENGSFTYITSLGVEKLPDIIKYVDQANPFYIPALFAVNDICGITIEFRSIDQWRNDFANKKANATDSIIELANNPKLSEKQINDIIQQYGILSLPELYNQVINKSNDWLLCYIYNALPNELKKNISNGTKDHDVLLSTLKECEVYISIIQSI